MRSRAVAYVALAGVAVVAVLAAMDPANLLVFGLVGIAVLARVAAVAFRAPPRAVSVLPARDTDLRLVHYDPDPQVAHLIRIRGEHHHD